MDNNAEATSVATDVILSRDSLSGEICQVVDAGSRELVLVLANGTYYAMDNQCSHADSWLDMGTVEAETLEIVCPLHGGAFALDSGAPTRSPCTAPIRTYPVSVTDESITISIGDRDG